ncbi:hypothetical protein [Massilia sp. TWR1-2-2]|uniref:hypothetical protein n=1 Tax=Massilia sp. TWR1-2-2 TaxID=2804584 RepID=UPI003CF1DB50
MFNRSLALLASRVIVCFVITACTAPVIKYVPPPVAEPMVEPVAPVPVLPPPPAPVVISEPVPAPAGADIPISHSLPVVYNASIKPQLPRDADAPERSVLQAGEPAMLQLYIGPMRLGATQPPVPVNIIIARSTVDVPLSVVLVCSFCEGHGDALRRMTYRIAERRSDEVAFQLTPKRRADGAAYTETLQITIMNDRTGVEYDRLLVPVEVNSAGARTGDSPDGQVQLRSASSFVQPDWQADVVLYAMETSDRNVSISIQPVSVAMTRLLAPLALERNGDRKVFRSGVDDSALVSAMTTSAYGAVSAIGTQNELLKRISATGANAYVSEESRNSLKLSAYEANNVTEILAANGQRLYRHLFYDSADEDLGKLIAALEEAEPVRRGTGLYD